MFEMILKSSTTKLRYDITSLVTDVQYTTSLKGQAGKLTFNFQSDPNEILDFDLGSIIEFSNDNEEVFKGIIFTIDLVPCSDLEITYKIVAYDEMRYLQNHGYYVIQKGKNVVDIFKEICHEAGIRKSKIDEKVERDAKEFTLDYHVFADVSYFEMFEYVFKRTYPELVRKTEDMQMTGDILIPSSDKFIIIDDFGELTLTQVSKLKTDLIIGYESLMTDFSITKSIDKDTFNDIIITQSRPNKSNNDTSQTVKKMDEKINSESISKWGKLVKIINVKDEITLERIKQYAESVLNCKNKPTQELKISAIGYNGIYAGYGVTISIARIGLNNLFMNKQDLKNVLAMDMYIESATHSYTKDVHTMEIELNMGVSVI